MLFRSLVQNGVAQLRRETTVGDVTVRASSVDVRTVGAGGGSIAHVPELTGALRVGPASAGADPGPAAYGKGGEQPTVTDANVVLGFLPTEVRLGGDMAIRRDLAEKAIAPVAEALGLSVQQAAAELRGAVGADSPHIATVVGWWENLAPGQELFGGAQPQGGGAEGSSTLVENSNDQVFDVTSGTGDNEESAVDFDLGFEMTATGEAAQDGEASSLDLELDSGESEEAMPAGAESNPDVEFDLSDLEGEASEESNAAAGGDLFHVGRQPVQLGTLTGQRIEVGNLLQTQDEFEHVLDGDRFAHFVELDDAFLLGHLVRLLLRRRQFQILVAIQPWGQVGEHQVFCSAEHVHVGQAGQLPQGDRKSTRLNSSHSSVSRMPSSA